MVWPGAVRKKPSVAERLFKWAPVAFLIPGSYVIAQRCALSRVMQGVVFLVGWWVEARALAWYERVKAEAQAREWDRKYCIPPRDFTMEQVARHDGSDVDLPILVVIRGKVFNVSRGAEYYGKDGPYNIFAGRDATWLLAKGELQLGSPAEMAAPLTALEEQEVDGWFQHFTYKYDLLGDVVLLADHDSDIAPPLGCNPNTTR